MKLNLNAKTLLCTLLALSACNTKEKHANEIEKTRTAVIDSMNEANRQQKIIDSLTVLSTENPNNTVLQTPTYQPESQTHLPKPKKKNSTPSSTSTAGTPAPGNTVNPSAGNGTVASKDTATANAEKKKKGLNNAAKGAIIGLGTGAAAGAILNKENRAKGAVIGGVIGAVGGAVGGAVIDKNKKKKDAEKDSTNKK